MAYRHSYGMSKYMYSSAIFIYSYYIYLLTKKDITTKGMYMFVVLWWCYNCTFSIVNSRMHGMVVRYDDSYMFGMLT